MEIRPFFRNCISQEVQYGVSELLLGGIEAVVRDIGMQDGPETLNRVWYPTIDPVLSLSQCS